MAMIADGWIVADRGRIVAYGPYGAVTRRAPLCYSALVGSPEASGHRTGVVR